MIRKLICLLLVVGLLGLGITEVVLGGEKEFPTKPIELIVPWGAGGATSVGARIVAGTLAEFLRSPVIIVNKTGGGGSVATSYVAKSKPDGYTLLVATMANNVIIPAIRSVDYTNADFELLASYGIQPHMLAVRSDAPLKTLQELVEDAKKEPGKFKFSSSGIGTSAHFSMECFKSAAGGLKIDHVPFKSGPEALAAALGGHVHMVSIGLVDAKGSVEAGKLRVLALSTEKRLDLKGFGDIPTFGELGYPDAKVTVFHGVCAPKGLPKETSDTLKDNLYKTIKHRDVQRTLSKVGFYPYFTDAEGFAKFVSELEKRIQRVAKEAGIRVK